MSATLLKPRATQRSTSGIDAPRVSKALVALVSVGALLAGLALGAFVARATASKTPVAAPTVVTAPKGSGPVGAGPSSFTGMVPVGYLHNEAGALAAAQAFTAMTTEMLFRPEADARAAARAIATPEGADSVEAVAIAPIQGIRDGFALAGRTNPQGRALVRTTPIGSRMVSYSGDKARVDVWAMSLVAMETSPNAQSQASTTRAVFSTTSYALEWSAGDWHVAELKYVGDSGPALIRSGPLPATQFIDQASGFTPFRYQANRGAQ